MKNKWSKHNRFVEILSGKVDFQENVIYVRDYSVEGRFDTNQKKIFEILRAETNNGNIRRRLNQEIPNEIMDNQESSKFCG